MGWNDRLIDDNPYDPYQLEADRAAYEAWHEYLLALAAEEDALSSQNLRPEEIRAARRTTIIEEPIGIRLFDAPAEEEVQHPQGTSEQ
jgi:hypothetical protein